MQKFNLRDFSSAIPNYNRLLVLTYGMAIPLSCFILFFQKEYHLFQVLITISDVLVPTTITFSSSILYKFSSIKNDEHPNLYLAVLMSFFYQMLFYISMKTSLLFDELSHKTYYILMGLEIIVIIFVLMLGAQVEKIKSSDTSDTNEKINQNVSG